MKYDGNLLTFVGDRGFSTCIAAYPSLDMDGAIANISFTDNSLTAKASVMTYNGSAWVNIGEAGFSASITNLTSLYVHNGIPYVDFKDSGFLNRLNNIPDH